MIRETQRPPHCLSCAPQDHWANDPNSNIVPKQHNFPIRFSLDSWSECSSTDDPYNCVPLSNNNNNNNTSYKHNTNNSNSTHSFDKPDVLLNSLI